MAGGIDITIDAAATLAAQVALATVSVSFGQDGLDQSLNNLGITVPTLGPYRDKQQNKPATYSITLPQSYNQRSAVTTNVVGSQISADTIQGAGTAIQNNAPAFFVFDAVFVASHSKRWIPTRKPLQSGYNFSDHVIKDQPNVTLEIGMSDAMQAFKPGMWTGNVSKSISCWVQMNALADSRSLFTLATRQETYQNMIIVGIESAETNKNIKGLNARITFFQMLLANPASLVVSARPNATDSTQLATLQPSDPSTTLIQQNQQTDLPQGSSDSVLNKYGIPSGGQFSSNPVGTN